MVESNSVFDTFRWSAKDRPIESGTRDAYKGSYIGYPVPADGYNGYFDRMTEDVDVLLGTDVRRVDLCARAVDVQRQEAITTLQADVIVSTIPIDELCGQAGSLPYAGRDFKLLMLPCKQVFPGDVRFCHYAGTGDDWTRVTEFKKITYHEAQDTLLVLETPSKNGKLYPYQTKANLALAKTYMDSLPANVYTIGRLGTYRYSTIEQTITQAFSCASKITGTPNEMEGQFFAIGDKSMLPSDRKEAA